MKLGNYVMDQESKDYSRSTDGGEYEFGHYPVIEDGKEIGALEWTSSSFDYCQINGTFTRTKYVKVEGTDIVFDVDVQKGLPDLISKDEFKAIL